MNLPTQMDTTFEELGIMPGLLKRMKALDFIRPTPIQAKAIPPALKQEDVLGVAQTGSGKTLAFSIPLLQRIAKEQCTGLILLPTRELAVQVQEELDKIAKPAGLRSALLIGGTNPNPQIRQLKKNPHVIVATPGRLIDLTQQKYVNFDDLGILVLDEADRMLDMGFEPQLRQIMKYLPNDRQTMLFSATMPTEIITITKKYMKSPVHVEVAPSGTTADQIDQEMFIVPKQERLSLLKRLLDEYDGTTLVFSRTKRGASKLARKLRKMGYTADEMHSNRSQNQRQRALKGFDSGKYRVLVATDIAARGIDISHIKLVVNYDLPDQLEDYVHRIGRTGRAGREGTAISFASPDQKRDIAKIQKLIKATIPIKDQEGEPMKDIPMHQHRSSRGRRRGRRRRSRRRR